MTLRDEWLINQRLHYRNALDCVARARRAQGRPFEYASAMRHADRSYRLYMNIIHACLDLLPKQQGLGAPKREPSPRTPGRLNLKGGCRISARRERSDHAP